MGDVTLISRGGGEGREKKGQKRSAGSERQTERKKHFSRLACSPVESS